MIKLKYLQILQIKLIFIQEIWSNIVMKMIIVHYFYIK